MEGFRDRVSLDLCLWVSLHRRLDERQKMVLAVVGQALGVWRQQKRYHVKVMSQSGCVMGGLHSLLVTVRKTLDKMNLNEKAFIMA